MRIFGTFEIIKINGKAYGNYINEQFAINVRQSARAFLRAAIPKVPVDTGMARGSFLFLGRFLRVAVPIGNTRKRQKYYGPGGPLPKTPESGAKLSTPPEKAFKTSGNKVSFEFQSKVLHYTLEDIFGIRSPTAPWKSFEAGREAFLAEMLKLTKRLASIRSYSTSSVITFGKGSGIKVTEKNLPGPRKQRVDVIT